MERKEFETGICGHVTREMNSGPLAQEVAHQPNVPIPSDSKPPANSCQNKNHWGLH